MANKKTLMIPGSTWIATKDIPVRQWRQCAKGQGRDFTTGPAELVLVFTIPKGTELRIEGKFSSFAIVGEGVSVPVSSQTPLTTHNFGAQDPELFDPARWHGFAKWPVTDASGQYLVEVPYSEVAEHLEQVGEPERQTYWLLRDAETGLFYRTTRYIGYMVDEVTRDTPPGFKPRQGYPYEMESNRAKAKKHTDLGKVKTTILNFTGYFTGLDQVDTKDWLALDRSRVPSESYPFVDTLEAVQYDKLTKEEIKIVPLLPWYERALRLRRITARYGASVRKVFDDLEKKDKLADFPYVLAFRNPTGLTPTQLADIEAAIKSSGIRGKKAKDPNSYAIAVETFAPAMATSLAAQGIEGIIVSTSTLEEATA